MIKDTLGEQILDDLIKRKIEWINKSPFRGFDEKLDLVPIALSERQFFVIKKDFGIKETYAICQGKVISQIKFKEYNIKFKYNDRMSIYEAICKSDNYIEDFDKREDYIDSKYQI